MKPSNDGDVNMNENNEDATASVLLHDTHPRRRIYDQTENRGNITDASWKAFVEQQMTPITEEGLWFCPSSRPKQESQKQLLLGLGSGKWWNDVLACFRSNCFEKPKRVMAHTIQGFVCKVDVIDENDPINRTKLKNLEKGWKMDSDQAYQKIGSFPSTVCVKVSFKFLVHSGESVNGNSVWENLINEVNLLREISSNPSCPESICKYVTHWETHGEWGEYYLATEYCKPNWEGVTKSMTLFTYVTRILHTSRLFGYAQIHKYLSNHGRKGNTFWPFSTYKRLDTIQRIFVQIVNVLDWLHSNGFAHLDISLENIVISGGTENSPLIKVIDFGVARKYSKLDEEQCREKRFVGKQYYFAPEVEYVKERENGYDPFAADMWTAGVCLWTMIFCSYPFEPEEKIIIDKEKNDFLFEMRNGKIVKEAPLDKQRLIFYPKYLYERMSERGFLPLVTYDAFDVLHKIFQQEDTRITAADLKKHPFCDKTRKTT